MARDGRSPLFSMELFELDAELETRPARNLGHYSERIGYAYGERGIPCTGMTGFAEALTSFSRRLTNPIRRTYKDTLGALQRAMKKRPLHHPDARAVPHARSRFGEQSYLRSESLSGCLPRYAADG